MGVEIHHTSSHSDSSVVHMISFGTIRDVLEDVFGRGHALVDIGARIDGESDLDDFVRNRIDSTHLDAVLGSAARHNCIEILFCFERLSLDGFDVEKVAAIAVEVCLRHGTSILLAGHPSNILDFVLKIERKPVIFGRTISY